MTYTTLEKIACLDRELALRRNVYAARIRQGKMRADTAQREIGLMEAIRKDYWTGLMEAIREDYQRWLHQSSIAAASAPTSGRNSTSADPPPVNSTKS